MWDRRYRAVGRLKKNGKKKIIVLGWTEGVKQEIFTCVAGTETSGRFSCIFGNAGVPCVAEMHATLTQISLESNTKLEIWRWRWRWRWRQWDEAGIKRKNAVELASLDKDVYAFQGTLRCMHV